MCRMPASTNASYVGRLAPPGEPNTTSTPSALSHSMMASTARIIGVSSSFREQRDEQGSLSAPERRRLRLHGHVRELQVGSAAHAHGVVELDEPAAPRALPAELVALGAVEDRADQPDDRHRGPDEEPQDRRGPLDLAHHAGGDPEPEGEDEVDHGGPAYPRR